MRRVVSRLFKVFIVFVAIFTMFACSKDKTSPTLTFEKLEVELKVGETYTLNPLIEGLKGEDLVKYTIDKPELLSISGSTVNALGVGSATVHASLKGYDNVAKDITFTISATKAKISKELQGDYYSSDIRVTVYTSKVKVNLGEDVLELTLYTDDNGIYVLDEVNHEYVKIYITFSTDKKSVTAGDKGTFTKQGDDTAKVLSTSLTGFYVSDDEILEVQETRIDNDTTYDIYYIYEDKDGIYFYDENEDKIYFTIENNTLSCKRGTYKLIEEDKTKIANLTTGLGKYYCTLLAIEIEASCLKIEDVRDNDKVEFPIYNLDGRYFIFDEGFPIEIVFESEKVVKVTGFTFSSDCAPRINAAWPSDLIKKVSKDINVPDFVSANGNFDAYLSDTEIVIDCNNITEEEFENYRALVATCFYTDLESFVLFTEDYGLFIEMNALAESIQIGRIDYSGKYRTWPKDIILEKYGVDLPVIKAKGYNVGPYLFEVYGIEKADVDSYKNALISAGFKYNSEKDEYVIDAEEWKLIITFREYNVKYRMVELVIDYEYLE